jgi:O-succinylbenzoate synthase
MSNATWPEGVIARYLTVGGATVDITDNSHRRGYIVAACTGERCGWRDLTDTRGYIYDTPEESRARLEEWLPTSQRHAQEHAEWCRAMARPAVDR